MINNTQDPIERLAAVFQALADSTRLRILGAIAERPMTGRELSERMSLSPPTISHHMAKLTAANLVTATPDAQRRHYALNQTTLRQMAQSSNLGGDRSRADLSPEERDRANTLRHFVDGRRLKMIPAQRKKRVIVLQHLLGWFEPGRTYTEKEVNALLSEAHEDVATLRRELVDYGYMTRDAGIYRVASKLPVRGATVAQEISGDEHAWLRTLVAGATERAIDDKDGHPS